MVRIYTRTGDDGTTGLIGGKRVSKDHLRIEAYGSVDELNALLGVVRSYSPPEPVERILQRIQDDLFTIGAALALPAGADRNRYKVPDVAAADVTALERDIDECEQQIEPLGKFILPGGTTAAALLHLARTVARRAERECVSLARAEALDPQILRYLNRLSDLCFVLARLVNRRSGQPEPYPTFGKKT